MPLFTKRPDTVNAVQFLKTGDVAGVIQEKNFNDIVSSVIKINGASFRVTAGDWIITDADGNLSVLDDATFNKRYVLI